MSMGLDPVRDVRDVSMDQYRASLGEYVDAVASDAWANNPINQLQSMSKAAGAQVEAEVSGERLMTAEEASAAGSSLGLRFDKPIAQGAYNVLAEEKRREQANQQVFQRARLENGYGTKEWLIGGGVEFLTMAVDPLNIASAFIPVVGEARYAMLAARAGRFGAGVARAGLEGAVGAAVLEPINVGYQQQLGNEYGMLDTLTNVAFGTGLGVALHGTAYGLGAGARFIRDKYVPAAPEAPPLTIRPAAEFATSYEAMRRLDPGAASGALPEWKQPYDLVKSDEPPPRQRVGEHMERLRTQTKETAMRVVVAQLAQDHFPDIEPALAADPSWPAIKAFIQDVPREVARTLGAERERLALAAMPERQRALYDRLGEGVQMPATIAAQQRLIVRWAPSVADAIDLPGPAPEARAEPYGPPRPQQDVYEARAAAERTRLLQADLPRRVVNRRFYRFEADTREMLGELAERNQTTIEEIGGTTIWEHYDRRPGESVEDAAQRAYDEWFALEEAEALAKFGDEELQADIEAANRMHFDATGGMVETGVLGRLKLGRNWLVRMEPIGLTYNLFDEGPDYAANIPFGGEGPNVPPEGGGLREGGGPQPDQRGGAAAPGEGGEGGRGPGERGDLPAEAAGLRREEDAEGAERAEGAGEGLEERPEFTEWFAGSKAVDASGKPQIVYHGTIAAFEDFDTARAGEATGAPSAKEGLFFASEPAVASSYAEPGDPYRDMGGAIGAIVRTLDRLTLGYYAKFNEKILTLFGGEGMRERAAPNVRPAYVQLRNPKIVDQAGAEFREQSYYDVIRQAKAEGHDGVIFRNTFDPGFGEGADKLKTDVFVVFAADQVRAFSERYKVPEGRQAQAGEPAVVRGEGERGGAAPARAAEPRPPPPQPAAGAMAPAAEAMAPAGELAVEPGQEGLPQTLIPGVAPITPQQRMEARAAAPMRGGAAELPAGGLFDRGAHAQGDIFDAPVAGTERVVRPGADPVEAMRNTVGDGPIQKVMDLFYLKDSSLPKIAQHFRPRQGEDPAVAFRRAAEDWMNDAPIPPPDARLNEEAPSPEGLGRYAERQQSQDMHADVSALETRDQRLAETAREQVELLEDAQSTWGHILDEKDKADIEAVGKLFDDEVKMAEAVAACRTTRGEV